MSETAIVIVPNDLAAAIDGKLDAAIAICPDAERDRAVLRDQILCYFDAHGHIPDFTLRKRGETDE